MSCASSFTPVEHFASEDAGRRRDWSEEDAAAIADFTDMDLVAAFLNSDDGVVASGTAGKVDYFIINDGGDADAAYVYKFVDDGDSTTSIEGAELTLIAVIAMSTDADLTINEVLVAYQAMKPLS